MKKSIFLVIVTGLLIGSLGCSIKDAPIARQIYKQPVNPFAIFNIYLTLIDSETKDPLSDLRIELFNKSSFRMSDSAIVAKQVSDSTGYLFISIVSTPPIPQEFVFTLSDTTQVRSFQQQYLSIRFLDPVFRYIQKDAAVWGNLYQGTAELTLTRELTQRLRHEQ
ncbi:MAG: hypothetical protein LBC84_08735 [Prevotellaceae bacterium]|jgi:hypothetical protein|nr:hypothetical protein [Prevotellaceae bacterium]